MHRMHTLHPIPPRQATLVRLKNASHSLDDSIRRRLEPARCIRTFRNLSCRLADAARWAATMPGVAQSQLLSMCNA